MYPNHAQQGLFARTLGCRHFVCNLHNKINKWKYCFNR
ncbi:helix-turn-helix domain-containing protein [Bacillus thuringiensis]